MIMSDQVMHDVSTVEGTTMATQCMEVDPITAAFDAIREAIAGQKVAIGAIERSMKQLERETRRLRQTVRATKRASGSARVRKPTGFACPGSVSPELLEFLGRQPGEKVARTDATRAINAYIKTHRLQDSTNARRILPDDKLRELLSPDPGTEITYFNLQQHMNRHFIRSSADVSAT
jgi:chromatin remodeling complex protein RSC6